MKYKFYQIDVFTEKALGGNPLAVFVDAKGLTSETMQKVAREMNLSETTFVLPSTNSQADFDIKIFTPTKEIPFAGHPTIGTAHILYEINKIKASQPTTTFNMGAGLINVSQERDYFFMNHPQPKFGDPFPSLNQVAKALSIKPSQISSNYPIQKVSTGFPAILVPVIELETMKHIQINNQELEKLFQDVDMLYVFSCDSVNLTPNVRVRAFAPFIGIPEDPATGSVAGALGAYFLKHQVLNEPYNEIIRIEQGHEMGRPSLLQVKAELINGNSYKIKVGGKSKTVIEGWLTL